MMLIFLNLRIFQLSSFHLGQGTPLDNNLLIKLIEYFENKPILGVCLGAQALTCYYGGEVIQGTKLCMVRSII